MIFVALTSLDSNAKNFLLDLYVSSSTVSPKTATTIRAVLLRVLAFVVCKEPALLKQVRLFHANTHVDVRVLKLVDPPIKDSNTRICEYSPYQEGQLC